MSSYKSNISSSKSFLVINHHKAINGRGPALLNPCKAQRVRPMTEDERQDGSESVHKSVIAPGDLLEFAIENGHRNT